MRLHVALDSFFFAGSVECYGELEQAAGDFGAGEVADGGLEGGKVGDEVRLGDLEAVVVDEESCGGSKPMGSRQMVGEGG